MSSIAKLIVTLAANTGAFESEMDKSARGQKRRMAQMERDVDAAAKKIGYAFVAVAAATAAVVAKTVNAADRMHELAIQTGLSTEALSQYKVIADKSGSSLESFTTGINKMQRSISNANEGMEGSTRAFARLGLSVADLMAMSPERQFETIAGKIAALESATLRTATAQEIFGRAGAALLPIMAEGEAGILAMREAVDATGQTITREFAAAADQFNDNMRDITGSAAGLGVQFTTGLLPALIGVQEEMLGAAGGFDVAREAGAKLGAALKAMVGSFVFLKETARVMGEVVVFAFLSILNAIKAAASPIRGFLITLTAALTQLEQGNFAAAGAAIAKLGGTIKAEFVTAISELQSAVDGLADVAGGSKGPLDAAVAAMNRMDAVAVKTAPDVEKVGKAADRTTQEAKDLGAAVDKLADQSFADLADAVEELEQMDRDFADSLEAILDQANPLRAAAEQLSDKFEILSLALARGMISAEDFEAAVRSLTEQFNAANTGLEENEQALDKWEEAALESVRILERAFTSLWENILDGGSSVWDGLVSGFKTMLANMLHQLITSPLVRELERVFSSGGGLGDINKGSLYTAIAGVGGMGLGSLLGGGGAGAGIGSGLGALFGKTMFKTFFPALFKSMGAWGGPVGIAVGAVLGGVLGGVFDKIFGGNDQPVLDISGFSRAGLSGSDQDTRFSGAFGDIFFRTRRMESADIQKFGAALVEFDAQIAAFLDGQQIDAIAAALGSWQKQLEGEAISLEAFLTSRFGVILSTFDADIQQFVKGAGNLEDQVNRLAVAVSAEKFMAAQPEIFSGRTLTEFLNIVVAFQDGTETITDAFNEVLGLLQYITSATALLKDYASSDPLADLALLSRTDAEVLQGMTSDLFDLVAGFDGSIEQLGQIASLTQNIRAAELQMLAKIDSITKAINATLERLRADITGIIEGPQSADQIMADAGALLAQIGDATTLEGLDEIVRQFDSLIRSIAPEDVALMGDAILALIDQFTAAANAQAETLKQQFLDSAQSARDMVSEFVATLGDPLDLLVASNQAAADYLSQIANGGDTSSANVATGDIPNWAYEQADVISVGIDETLAEGMREQAEVLATGAQMMRQSMTMSISQMARELESAVRTGFAGATVNVNVTLPPEALVTE